MSLTATTRLLAVAVLLALATALVWWLVGFPLGKALLDGASPWTRGFSYEFPDLVRLLALAVTVVLTGAVAGSASPQTRWLAIAAVALGAAVLFAERGVGDTVAVVLLVLGAAAMTETEGAAQAVAAAAIAVLVAFAATGDLALGTSQKVFAVLLRALFFYAPLLLGPAYLDRFVVARTGRGK